LNWLNRYLEFLISVPPAKIKTQEEVETDKMAAAQQKVLKPPTTQQKKINALCFCAYVCAPTGTKEKDVTV
jgi:hypothetical protein